MNRLLRLYPAAWQERYGEEMSRILDDRPPSPFDVADLLLGAIDAHLHLRGLGKRSEHRKGIPMSLHLAGLAAVLSGGLWASFFVYVSTAYGGGGGGSSLLWIPLVVLAGLALVVALAGLSGQRFRASPGATWAAVALPAGGVGMALLGLAIGALAGDFSYDEGEFGTAFLYVGLMVMLLGSLAFAAISASLGRAALIASAAIFVGAVLTLAGLFSFTLTWLAVGGLSYGVGWIGLGIDAIRRGRSTTARGAAPA
jgi:hypothetical protein